MLDFLKKNRKKNFTLETKKNNLIELTDKNENNLIALMEKNDELSEKINKNTKHFPSSVREWNNSIYLYDKNSLNLIPSATKRALSIIRDYFSFFNMKLEKKIRNKRLLLRLRRLSSNRIHLSKGEFKHSNNKVLINLYVFNRQKSNYLSKLKKIYLSKENKNNFKKYFIKSIKNIYKKGFFNLKKINSSKYFLIKTLNIIEKNEKYKISNFKNLNNLFSSFYKNLFLIFMKKYRLYFLYKQLIYLNVSKLNYTYLRLLKKHLEFLYNKNVEFNLINLKRFYLNSDILSDTVKLKLTKNKRKMRKILKKIKEKVKIRPVLSYNMQETNTGLMLNSNNDQLVSWKRGKQKGFNNEKNKNNILEKNIITNLKYRHVTGFRLQAKGRLTRRYTASRSLSKVKYAGNLLDIDSSYLRLSSVLLKGNLKSNVQYTKVSSKTRIGSFGIKGWVSGN